MASPSFQAVRPGEAAIEVTRLLERAFRDSRAIDQEALCVLSGHRVRPGSLSSSYCYPWCACATCIPYIQGSVDASCSPSRPPACMLCELPCQKWGFMISVCVHAQVWSLSIDVHVLDNGGNLADACMLSTLAALLAFRRPDTEVAAGGGGADSERAHVTILSPSVREPVPLSLHHLPLAVSFAVFEVRAAACQALHVFLLVWGGFWCRKLTASGHRQIKLHISGSRMESF